MRFRIVWSEAQCLADVFDGHVAPSHLVGEQAQQMQRPDMARIYLQDLTADLFGQRQAPPLMVLQCRVEGLSDCEHRFPPENAWPRPLRQAGGPDDNLKAKLRPGSPTSSMTDAR